jgi:uncharacterized integral membrane protein
VLFVVFMVENGRSVRVTFVFWEVNSPLTWALVLSGITGFVAGFVVAWPCGCR